MGTHDNIDDRKKRIFELEKDTFFPLFSYLVRTQPYTLESMAFVKKYQTSTNSMLSILSDHLVKHLVKYSIERCVRALAHRIMFNCIQVVHKHDFVNRSEIPQTQRKF